MLKPLLDRVNRTVNKKIVYMKDTEQYKVEEKWAMPGRFGDCEDYALLKRRMLLDAGVSIDKLKLTMAITEMGEYHIVLGVDDGDTTWILDNRYPTVRRWCDLPYVWVSRQKGDKWVSIPLPS